MEGHHVPSFRVRERMVSSTPEKDLESHKILLLIEKEDDLASAGATKRPPCRVLVLTEPTKGELGKEDQEKMKADHDQVVSDLERTHKHSCVYGWMALYVGLGISTDMTYEVTFMLAVAKFAKVTSPVDDWAMPEDITGVKCFLSGYWQKL
ncbi:hypothetical protein H0E87_019166 [Populus deltoides]|uniref:Uncharacterized protein n=1 Tax=Populus deltoides TaxID=3696 RepID=A0A8T2XT74_POPDE|nr:hypothetical protein H0E87_019166 [Populus deltoides]